jgi:hypothetical protein
MFVFHRAAAGWSAAALATATALTPALAAGADPADPHATVPAVGYASPFKGYRAHAEPPVQGWRAANDEVKRIGGWRFYTREAQRALTAPAPASAPDKPPPPTPATGDGRP